MKILVISDTHGNYPAAVRAAEKAGKIDHIFHLGDLVEDAMLLQDILDHPVIRIAGNCDFARDEEREMTLSVGNIVFFVCHGDRFSVKSGISRLKSRALREKATVVLFGHTHVAGVTESDGITFVNPGSMRESDATPTFAVLTMDEGQLRAEIVTL